MKNKSLTMLNTFLENNEQNIATDQGNMGYLAYIFNDVMGRKPADETPKAATYRYGHHPAEQALDQ